MSRLLHVIRWNREKIKCQTDTKPCKQMKLYSLTSLFWSMQGWIGHRRRHHRPIHPCQAKHRYMSPVQSQVVVVVVVAVVTNK